MTAHGDHTASARALLDPAADERGAVGLLAALRASIETRVLVLYGDRAPLAQPGRLEWSTPDVVVGGAEWAFLGRDGSGRAHLVAAFPEAAPDPLPGATWGRLRVVGGMLDAQDAAAFVTALCLGRWLLDAPFCSACGARAEVHDAGWSRRCPACGRQHFPRTDPAVIVAVASVDGERLLLGSNALWDQDRYSCFAGFVEAGESLERAIGREVAEECGIDVAVAEYRGSQAWPYPRSLMLGFLARAADDAPARPDGTEIVQVRWFSRAEISAALRGESSVKLPGTASIAHRLIRDWCEESPEAAR
jgi:NAD+ diphosphatase